MQYFNILYYTKTTVHSMIKYFNILFFTESNYYIHYLKIQPLFVVQENQIYTKRRRGSEGEGAAVATE